MKAHKFIFFFTLLFATVCTYAQEITPSDTPNETQKAMLKRGYGMFIHFGVNTFSGDEWSDGTVPVSAYNPTRLDCDQWVRVARDAGFRYVLLITKHHDGFCLFDSALTDYKSTNAPCGRDLVREFVDAVRAEGLRVGLYYSLLDWHHPDFPKYKDPNHPMRGNPA